VNYTAETSLITALFFDDPTGGTATDLAGTLLSADDFEDEGCRLVFRATLKLRQEGLPVDLCHTADVLCRDLPGNRAIPMLNDATNGSPLPNCIPQYAKKIKDQVRIRKLKSTIGLAGEQVQGGRDVSAVKSELISDMERIEADQQSIQDQPIGDAIMPALNAMADRLSGDDSKKGMKTGIADLDAVTTGLNPGELWICGAMPGRGKTALALQVAMNVAGRGYPVYFISLEMSTSAVIRRLLKMRFESRVVENPTQAQWSQMLEYAAELKTLPLYINDSSGMEASEIAQRSRLKIARSGIRLIIVDYLQIVRGPGRDRRERTGDAADTLRRLAKDTGVPVLALSQLRRPDSLNDRPSMIELKESGDLEAHAHVVLLNYMPINEDGTFQGEEEIIIGKQREGPTGSIPVWFDRSRVIFRPRDRR
jgi:replicative DNA helicase